LDQLRSSLGLNLIVAHLNHCLRGEESDGDQAFVEVLAGWLSLTVESRRVAVKDLHQEHGGNLQSLARRIRYQLYEEVAGTYHANWIATGHTQDDQAETVLLALIRGTARRGLSGIAPRKKLGDLLVVRPILGISREEILEYLMIEG